MIWTRVNEPPSWERGALARSDNGVAGRSPALPASDAKIRILYALRLVSAASCGQLRLKAFFGGVSFALFAPFCSAAPADPLDTLVKRSPFIPTGYVPGGSAKPINRTNTRLEFGGYTEANGRTEVSISNSATGESVWVALRDKTAPYFVESFDAVGMSIAVKVDGTTVRLPLRTTTLDTQPMDSQAVPITPTQAIIMNPGSEAKTSPAEPNDKKNDLTVPEPFRIPRQELRIPKRVDDPI